MTSYWMEILEFPHTKRTEYGIFKVLGARRRRSHFAFIRADHCRTPATRRSRISRRSAPYSLE